MIFFVVFVFALLSLYAICYIELGWFWAFGELDDFEIVNRIILNFSYSYVAALVFYVLTVWLPFEIRKRKLRKPIFGLAKVVCSKFIDSAKSPFSLFESDNIKMEKDVIVSKFRECSIFQNSSLGTLGVNITVLDHLKGQRLDIKERLKDILVYKEYLSEKQLLLIEDLRNCTYFSLLNAFNLNRKIDNEQIRESLASALFDAWKKAEELKISLQQKENIYLETFEKSEGGK